MACAACSGAFCASTRLQKCQWRARSLCEDASDGPDVDAGAVRLVLDQKLGRPVPARHNIPARARARPTEPRGCGWIGLNGCVGGW
eukprot:4887309-Pleurochrysis_carterae.AAC.1